MKYFLIYIVCINILTFMLFGIDKHKAKNGSYRIRESTLLGFCAVLGSVGGYMGMRFFHHKTHKKLFTIGVPLIFIIQIIVLYLLRGFYGELFLQL